MKKAQVVVVMERYTGNLREEMLPPKTWDGVFVLIRVAIVNDPCWFTVYKGTPLRGEGIR